MKNIFNKILGMLLFSVMLFSCTNEIERIVIAPNGAPSGVAIDNNKPLICTTENAKDTVFVISWEPADFGKDISSVYTLQIDVKGNNFASPQEVTVGNCVYVKHLTSDNLNSIMHKLVQPIDVATDLEVRVKAVPMVLGSSEPTLPELYSSTTVGMNVTSFAMAPFHMIGSMFGDFFAFPNVWDINNYRFVMFRNDPLSTDEYTGYFLAFNSTNYAGQFKFMKDADLGTYNMYGKKGDSELSPSGGNFELSKDGYYTITANVTKLTYTIKEFDASAATEYTSMQLSGTGVASPVTLTQAYYDPHIWVADDIELSVGKLTFNSGSDSWSAKSFPYGKASIGGEDITVSKAGKYFIKFSDLTGHYVFYQKK